MGNYINNNNKTTTKKKDSDFFFLDLLSILVYDVSEYKGRIFGIMDSLKNMLHFFKPSF